MMPDNLGDDPDDDPDGGLVEDQDGANGMKDKYEGYRGMSMQHFYQDGSSSNIKARVDT